MGFCKEQEKSISICKIVKEEADAQQWMVRDVGGRLSCSSDEVVETRWSEGLSLFGFVMNIQPQNVG
jgi:hypothetical protein